MLNKIENILKVNQLFFEKSASKKPLGRSDFKGLGYIDIWRKIISKSGYDFRLKDNSLLIFDADAYGLGFPRYAYYPSPFDSKEYVEFLLDFDDIETMKDVYLAGSFHYEEYEQYLIDSPAREYHTTIRFDRDRQLYRPQNHPEYHLHFGMDNNIRVGIASRMTEVDFIYFILRQFYPSQWETYMAKHQKKIAASISHESCLTEDYFSKNYEMEIFLGYFSINRGGKR